MSEEFKIIETQEQLDSILKGRLEREQKKHSEATAGLQSEIETLKSTNAELSAKISAYDEKYAGYDENIANLQNQIKAYESDSVKTRICKEIGLPYEFKDRLRGETEEDIKKDAEDLIKIIPRNEAPKKQTEVIQTEDEGRSAFRDMLKNL